MARTHHHRGAGYPTYQGSVGTGAGGGDGTGAFEDQPDLGGVGAEGSGGGGMPSINIVNTAIANAYAEQGPGGISGGPISTGGIGGGGGGGGHHHHHGPAHHHH